MLFTDPQSDLDKRGYARLLEDGEARVEEFMSG